jgi:hypothetical protein
MSNPNASSGDTQGNQAPRIAAEFSYTTLSHIYVSLYLPVVMGSLSLKSDRH